MRAWALVACVLAGCGIEHLPPVVLVRQGEGSLAIHRAVVLPAECASHQCQALDAVVAAELAFRGIDVIDLDRIAAVERARTEIEISTTALVKRRPTSTGHVESEVSRRLEVRGPLLSDLDVWSMRDQLATMGVDAIVRVRIAAIEAKPQLVLAMVRVTRASDASLVWSSVCQLELHAVDTEARAADIALHCALGGALRTEGVRP